MVFFSTSRTLHTRSASVTGVQTCALPIYGFGFYVRSQRLLDLDRFDQFRRNDVERDRAHVRFRGRHAAAVDGRRLEVRIEAAHGNEASLALVVQAIDPRRPAERLRDVLGGNLSVRGAGQPSTHAHTRTTPGT